MNPQLSLGYVFGLGMIAVFNPCGFAMLPAWIAYFVSRDEAEGDRLRSVLRATVVGVTLTFGFVAVFLVLGLAIQLTAADLVSRLPWLSIALGSGMVVLAVAILFGRDVNVRMPLVSRAPRSRSLTAVFGFGVSYAFVSLACTIPLFLAAVTTSLTSGDLDVGILHFVAYAAGMGVILTALTAALALAQTSLVGEMRRVARHVKKVGALLLAVAGAYVAYYGWYSLRVYDGDTDPGGPAQLGYDFSAWMSDRINGVGSVRVGLLAVLAILVLIAVPALRRGPHPQRNDAPASSRKGDREVPDPKMK
jgi:cytochrome c biogenesis protein CcdA